MGYPLLRWVSMTVAILLLAASVAVPAADAETSDETIALYNKRCAMCHGKDGVATKMAKGSPNLNDPEWKATTSLEKIQKNTAEGVGKMKGLSDKLTAEEIAAIARYVMAMK